ncbi:phospholipid/cholesterol/gamma-HCH transport system substrate-binding protein [Pseudarcicella hirudinis]|uniref:Phospholipid/cholesterol/gamma-HCH transport system substrate-binding protein n=1 Tax=Pseudarcicella hirudinis TaxID=1079859 RepID=A0A1I5R003_9BACT|nr:MlaD family protein [Pseudarcicella hirudinis]SFP51825.1 phospholipid/cholesterol/gamma-HCH transport system substrate-binding protein [Pseudarcicella hirudinis]
MNISKEAKVGILALVSFVILYLGFNFLKGSDLFSSTNKYLVVYDNVDGLVASNPVMLNGLSIGRVKSVDLMQDKQNKLLVVLEINNKISVPGRTEAILADGGLLGGKMINLRMGSGKPLADGDTLIPVKDVGISELLKTKALPVMSNADSLLTSLRTVTLKFKDTGEYLNAVLKNSDKTITGLNGSVTGLISENRSNLAGITGNMKNLTASLVETEKGLKPLLGKFNTMADSLNALRLGQTLNETKKTVATLNKILAGLEAGQGTTGKLLKDDSLYVNLTKAMTDLDKLLIDFRLAPKRYVNISVFGKKTPPPVVK